MKVETYLINLDGSDQRLESATKQLNEHQIAFTRFPAVDGRKKSLDQFVEYNDGKAHQILGRSLLNSELGCYLSHYGCVKKFLETDSDYLVVLEDDMDVSDDFKIALNAILEYLDTHKTLDWYLINIAAKKKKFAQNIVNVEDKELWHAYYFPIRGLGLIWSRKGAEEFYQIGKEITMPVDIFFQRWLSQNAKGLGVWPALVKPLGLDSDILGTVATEGIARKEKEQRDASYTLKKQKRMWKDRFYAFKHMINR